MDKKINDKLKKAKDLITLGQPEEALDLLHTVLMSDCKARFIERGTAPR